MTQATLITFYTLYGTLGDTRQQTKCSEALKTTYGVDTAGEAIGNTTD